MRVGRPRKLDDEYLAHLAMVRIEERIKNPKSITAAMAARLDLRTETVRDRLVTARQRGFLVTAGQGKRHVAPGPALKPYLEANPEWAETVATALAQQRERDDKLVKRLQDAIDLYRTTDPEDITRFSEVAAVLRDESRI